MGAIDANACRTGTKLLLDNELYTVLERAHHKPGKGGAFVRFKLKGIVTGKVVDHTVRAGTKMESADVTTQTMQYLYQDGDNFVFITHVAGDFQSHLLAASHNGQPMLLTRCGTFDERLAHGRKN